MTKERRTEVRAALEKAGARTIVSILSDQTHRGFKALVRLLERCVTSEIPPREAPYYPEAFRAILERHPSCPGLFRAVCPARAPGQTPVQHHYEPMCAAALMTSKHFTTAGSPFEIRIEDKVAFGVKFARGYEQPRRYGTIEADILVHRPTLHGFDVFGVDAKHTNELHYRVPNRKELARQLSGLRTAFRDGKLDRFLFATNAKFGAEFIEMVDDTNAEIARDHAKRFNLELRHHGTSLLTTEERKSSPEAPVTGEMLVKGSPALSEFIARYHVPQVELCQKVIFETGTPYRPDTRSKSPNGTR